MTRRVLVVAVSLLFLGSAALAHDQESKEEGGAALYTTTACQGTVADCYMTATSVGWPNPSPYTVFARLTLPRGNYLLTGKLSYYSQTPTQDPAYGWGNLECFMGLEDESDGDYSSAGVVGDEYVVFMSAPVRLTARTTTIEIGCKLFGAYYWNYWLYVPYQGIPNGDLQPVQVGVWGVRLTAERIASFVRQ